MFASRMLPSLRLLAATPGRHQQTGGRLLLIGDPVPPKGSDFERLPNAAKEMQSVQKYFSAATAQVYREPSFNTRGIFGWPSGAVRVYPLRRARSS